MKKNDQEFVTFDQFEKAVFPRAYEERKRRELIQEVGYGVFLADQFLDAMRAALESLGRCP